MENEKTVWKYSVNAVGVRKGCRKVDFHSPDAILQTDDKPSEAVAVSLALAWLRDNMKTIKKAHATATLWTIEDGMETWEMMNDEHNLKWPIQ